MTALSLAPAILLATLGAEPARAMSGMDPAATALPADPALAQLIDESLARRPELKQADALARAERERIPQAGALQDPVLSLGIQNDGFGGIQIGKMETSFWQVMVTQPLPWPGKLGLRTEVATAGARLADAAVLRARLSAEAEVRRGYLDLLLARDRLALLARLEALWAKAEGLARARYETGEGAQSDVLRARLERNRLKQRRWSLEAEERTRLQALNRLRGHDLDDPIPTTSSVRDLGLPALPDQAEARADAERRSPELLTARLQADRATSQVALAQRDRFPDLAVTAAIMPRGGLEPMWQAGVSLSLPIFSGRKQARAVAESEARAAMSGSQVQTVEQILHQRVQERLALLASLVETGRIYERGLLIQSQATADSTLSQYRVGRVTFASVLEAIGGVVNDEDGYLATVAGAQRVAIAAAEVSLEPSGGGGGGLGGGGMPGAGAAGGGGGATAASAGGGEPAASSSTSSSMNKM
jgi:outer membrane protein TolC